MDERLATLLSTCLKQLLRFFCEISSYAHGLMDCDVRTNQKEDGSTNDLPQCDDVIIACGRGWNRGCDRREVAVDSLKM